MKIRILSKLFYLVCALLVASCSQNDRLPTSKESIVNVDHTPVERQSIGNCWLYAHASWAESLHKTATGEDFDVSQSYWTYMDWFNKLLSGDISDDKLSTGGGWSLARNIINTRGLMDEKHFITEDTNGEISYRQSSALDQINQELKEGGRLATPQARADRVKVREVLDEAWELSDSVKEELDRVFGPGLEKTFNARIPNNRATLGPDSIVIAASGFAAKYSKLLRDGNSYMIDSNLFKAIREWRYQWYSPNRDGRKILRRVQRALHDLQPVIISWYVDFNALEKDSESPFKGSFNLKTLEVNAEPGRQGGHMTVLEDYEITNVPSFETVASETHQVAKNQWIHLGPFKAEGHGMKITMRGNNDADLYVSVGQKPTVDSYDCRPFIDGSSEECFIKETGEVYIAIFGYATVASSVNVEIASIAEESITLKAGATLDPKLPEDKSKLDAALFDEAEISFLRVKNSWGTTRGPWAEGAEFGYHDLYMDYLNGPITKCDGEGDDRTCEGTINPLSGFILPPGY